MDRRDEQDGNVAGEAMTAPRKRTAKLTPKQRVKRERPNAVCVRVTYYVIMDGAKRRLSGPEFSPREAWQSAAKLRRPA